ncbi:single-stranded DNA-binding protein [bacterium]|nr:single-stranded DNA-binding protein [bacterium]
MKFKREMTCHGNVVANPTLREGDKNGRHYTVSDFTVAVNIAKNAPPFYLNCTAWDAVAKEVKKEVKKGMFVEVVGEPGRPNAYIDKNGAAQASYRLRVNNFSEKEFEQQVKNES